MKEGREGERKGKLFLKEEKKDGKTEKGRNAMQEGRREGMHFLKEGNEGRKCRKDVLKKGRLL